MKTLNPLNLVKINKPYPESFLERWRAGDYSMLTNSQASEYIKKIIVHKAKNRPGRRFFGEAYIASNMEMVEGWYTSYKWLTAPKWIVGEGLKPGFEKSFYLALMKYIGKDCLISLQEEATKLVRKYKKPVAPDLWIIDNDGCFNFIESKLPDDFIGKHQLAGLALIEKFVGAVKPVSIVVMDMAPEK